VLDTEASDVELHLLSRFQRHFDATKDDNDDGGSGGGGGGDGVPKAAAAPTITAGSVRDLLATVCSAMPFDVTPFRVVFIVVFCC
jgi:hypothetical protein